MALNNERPNYSFSPSNQQRNRLSVHIPKDTLSSSIMDSSHQYNFDPETARLAYNVNLWLASDDEISRPSSIAPSIKSFQPRPQPSRMNSVRNSIRHSFVGSLRYTDGLQPRPTPQIEDAERLQGSSAEKTTPPTQGAGDDGGEYPSGMKLALIILALCLAVFVMALGKSIPLLSSSPHLH